MRGFTKIVRAGARISAVSFVLAGLLASQGVLASHNGPGLVGDFQIDGNFAFPQPAALGGSLDWANVGGVARLDDASGTASDDVFSEGSKESDPSGWAISTGGYPPKTDITRGYFASSVTTSDAFLWLGFERLDSEGQGNANINFELNQGSAKVTNAKGATFTARQTGDLLITYDYAGGEKAVAINVLEWTGSALVGSWKPLSPPPTAMVGDINATGVTRPGGVFGGGSVGPFRFGEVGLRMTLSSFSKFLTCPASGSMYVKSRSSGQSFNSALRDVSPSLDLGLSTCGEVTVLKQDDVGGALDGATFTLWRDGGVPGVLEPSDESAGTCVSGEEGTLGRCTFENVAPGNYLVQETGVPDGFVLDPTVSAFTVGRKESVVVPHTYVNPKIQYRLGLTPQEDSNLVDSDHVFNVHLERSLDSGGTWGDAAGEAIAFSLAGPGSIKDITPGGVISADGTSGSCTTSASGECSVTVRSLDPGESTLTASFDKSTATTPIDIDSSAVKRWVNYRILVQPDGHTNRVGTPHEFSVTLQKTGNGTDWEPVPGAAPAISISGPGQITSNSCASGTGSDGSCKVSITSSVAGDTSITAKYDAVVGSSSRTFTQSADKSWVDYRVAVTGDDTNLVGESHQFVATVQIDTGTGFGPLVGVPVKLDWSGPSGSGITGGTCTGDGVTGSDGTCTVTVNSSSAGTGVLTVVYETTLDSGLTSTSSIATKKWLDFDIAMTPGSAVNDVNQPHVFTVTLRQDEGDGFKALADEPLALSLDRGVSQALILAIDPGTVNDGSLSGSCTTDANGQCSITVNSSTAGIVTLRADWTKSIGSSSTANETASATKTYLDASLLKEPCPTGRATPGQIVTYDLDYSTRGSSLTGATVIDDLPSEVRFLGASHGGIHNGVTPGGRVTWNLGQVSSDGSVSVTVEVLESVDGSGLGTLLTNNAVFDADVIAPRPAKADLLVTTAGAAASGRAYGVRADVLGGGLLLGDPDIASTPDTDVANPAELTELDVPGVLHTDVLNVFESRSVANTSASDTAIVTASDLTLELPGVSLRARSLVARSSTNATGFASGSTPAGSRIQDLVINEVPYGDKTNSDTIIIGPATAPIAEVRVLEKLAGGSVVPGFFTAGLDVNALHVIVHDDPLTELVNESSDVVVGHAESRSAFPSALACGESNPSVRGDAFDTALFGAIPAGAVTGLVTLHPAGGNETEDIAEVPFLGTVAGRTHTEGGLSPLQASSSALLNDLDLLSGLIKAKSIYAFSSTGADETTVIEDLVIDGTDVCAALGLESTCTPDPDTVLVLDGGGPIVVVLNEQGALGGRVNAIHIFAVGHGNPFGLPAGAELIIGSAFAGTG